MTADAHDHDEESWYFDFFTPDAGLAGYARLSIRRGEGKAWWWAAVVGPDLPFVLVKEHDVDRPRGRALEIRASGLWAEPVCEIPDEHWSLGMEAFGVCLDDPVEAYRLERGDIIALGFDLEWTAEGALINGDGHTAQPCLVDGDVLVGRRRYAIEALGIWQHASGPRDWSSDEWSWMGGREVEPLPVDEQGLLADGLLHAPVKVGSSRLARALCRTAEGKLVWAERLQPASSALG